MAMRTPATIAIIALLAVAGCGSDDDSSSGGSSGYGSSAPKAEATDKVDIADFKYGPASIEVAKGTKVSFTNEDSAKHTATSKPQGKFDSGDIAKGQTKPVTFKEAGTFNYYCVYHPTMAGKVKVTE